LTTGGKEQFLVPIAVGAPGYFGVLADVAEPEINLVGNGYTIPDGDASPALLDFTDFGPVNVGNSLAVVYEIENLGSAYLYLTESPIVVISGTHAAVFTVLLQPSGVLAPSEDTSFTVEFEPSALGLRTATVSIANTDSDENPYDFMIQGTGGEPEIDVKADDSSPSIPNGDATPSFLEQTDFKNVDMNESVYESYQVHNYGSGYLYLVDIPMITITGPHANDFSIVQPLSGTIDPSTYEEFEVSFQPSTQGDITATVTIPNNDSNEDPYTFEIMATAGHIFDSGFLISDIPDNGCGSNNYLEETIQVNDVGLIADLNVTIVLNHDYDWDLLIYLKGPDGTVVELSTNNGSLGDDYTGTIFDDEAATLITAGSAPFEERFQSEGSLSDFDGKPIKGTWTLQICDYAYLMEGRLLWWELTANLPRINLPLIMR